MKRVYVRPAARGISLGRRLVERLLDEARRMGYTRVALDVLSEFTHAQPLYRSLGFEPAAPVGFKPVPGTLFLARSLYGLAHTPFACVSQCAHTIMRMKLL